MKKFILSFLIISFSTGWLQANLKFTRLIDELFKNHVVPGMVDSIPLNLVDYQGIQADARYGKALEELGAIEVNALKGDDAKAFWINAYNILAVKMVLDHYPVKGIKDIGSLFNPVWDKEIFSIKGKPYTLNEIEHKILRPMGDPRIHAAIVCASLSCPDLRIEAYDASWLDEQLDDQVRLFVSNKVKGTAFKKGKIIISSIFKWFDEDFDASGGVKDFLRKYVLVSDRAKITEDISIGYFSYDWSLNDKARKKK